MYGIKLLCNLCSILLIIKFYDLNYVIWFLLKLDEVCKGLFGFYKWKIES